MLQQKEIDRPDSLFEVEEIKDKHSQWNQYKFNFTEKTLKEMYLERNKGSVSNYKAY